MSGVISGRQRAALVMLALDEVTAAEIVKNLEPAALRELAEAADALDTLLVQRFPEALEAFAAQMKQPVLAYEAGLHLRRLAATSLGAERARALFAPSVPGSQPPIEQLRGARAPLLADLLDQEHPQLAAVIISQLPRAQAAKVLEALPAEKQADVIARIAKLEALPAESSQLASQAIAEALASTGASTSAGEEREFDGLAFAASLLNDLAPEAGKAVLDRVAASEEALVPKLREAMFTFEDLLRIDKRGIQTLMREVTTDRLVVALKTASHALREHLIAGISLRAGTALREDLEALPPMRLADVEAAQQAVLQIAARLGAEGRLVIPAGGTGGMV